MAETVAAQSSPPALAGARGDTRDRLAGFRVIYLAIFAFVMLYVLSVEVAETALQSHFRTVVAEAVRVSPIDGPIIPQIQTHVAELVHDSLWVRWGGVRVNVTVIGADGKTPLYVGAGALAPPPPPPSGFDAAMREAIDLLPPIVDVNVAVPHGSLLSASFIVVYGAVLLQGLFFYQRAVASREAAVLGEAVHARDEAARRARSIEDELDAARTRLRTLEPTERSQSEAIQALQTERSALQQKLRELAERESELRSGAARGAELEQETRALEDLLEEALEDVGQKDREIHALQDRLASAARSEGRTKEAGGRAKETERIARRLRALYKNCDFDDRAIDDLMGLGDESLRLRAEEAIKRLADEPETAAVRRKVGGLPSQLSVFELGFAGKGRVYYVRNERGGFRIVAVGGKATQKQDMEYLSRLG